MMELVAITFLLRKGEHIKFKEMKITDSHKINQINGEQYINKAWREIGDSFYDEITTKQWFVIAMLEVFGDYQPSLNELSKEIGSSHQNVKQLVLKLEQKGYVTLYTDPTDRRKSRVKLNEKIEEIRYKYHAKQEQFIKNLYHNIDSKELKNAVRVMMKMQENMEEM